MKAIAFAPGHISGFFQPIYHHNIYQTGSRGAGVNLDKGCIAEVELVSGPFLQLNCTINGINKSSSVVKTAVKSLIGSRKLIIDIKLKNYLPISQGFGMSAASAISATLAIAQLLNLPRIEAIKAAHYAEVTLKTGLGDVAAANIGGIEIREKPGIPPWGKLHKIKSKEKIVICVIDSTLSTKKILSDEKMKDKINQIGKDCTDQLILNPTIDYFFQLSKKFAIQTNLIKTRVLDAIDAVEPYGMASMCMLGNSVFAYGKIKKIVDILSDYGTTEICGIDSSGARIV